MSIWEILFKIFGRPNWSHNLECCVCNTSFRGFIEHELHVHELERQNSGLQKIIISQHNSIMNLVSIKTKKKRARK